METRNIPCCCGHRHQFDEKSFQEEPAVTGVACNVFSKWFRLADRKRPKFSRLTAHISSFCSAYGIDPSQCAEELFTFAPSFSKFNRSLFNYPKQRKEYFYDLDDSDSEEESYDDNEHDESDDDDDNADGVRENKDVPSFLEALKILAHPDYHLVDAYPTLCKVYAIAVAIPISSATAERSFSALKRVKTRIQSTMLQGRLEALLLMAVERQILHCLDKQCIIDMFAKTSKELTKALL